MNKTLGVLIGAVMMVAGLTACGNSDAVYRPAAYGENGHCYYVDSPDEVYGLQRDGYCPNTWVPMLMPTYWHLMYAPYYSSPAYYGTFVPASRRTTYITVQKTYVNTHQSQIKSAVKSAKYKDAKTGKTVPGSKFGTRTFTGGTGRGGFGSGSGRKTCSLGPISADFIVGYGGGGARSGGYGGGGARTTSRTSTTTRTGSSGGSGTSKTTTKSRSGC